MDIYAAEIKKQTTFSKQNIGGARVKTNYSMITCEMNSCLFVYSILLFKVRGVAT